MSQCLNPDCLAVNPETHRFCQKCGQKLWLKERYRALKLIGQGGFGKTFLAVDLDKPSRPHCVIKQFFPQGQGTGSLGKAAELFQEEAKRLDELGRHNQIPELLAYFIAEDQRQYLVQEYVAGQNLAQELAAQGVFNEAKIRALLADLLPVLDFIHRNQVIHRDIKPENIIRRQGDQKLVLVDFGAAKAVTPQNRSVTGTVIGSAEYVAPEQMNGKAVNASDLYSLGVTCLHLLTGVSPFDLFDAGEHEWCWRDYLVKNPVSAQFGAVLDKMIVFGTKKRYQSAGEVLIVVNPPAATSGLPSVIQYPSLALGNLKTIKENLGGGFNLELIQLPPGQFMMGASDNDDDAYDSEKPQHLVKVNSFAVGKYPITQGQYEALMGKNPSRFQGSLNNPVERVSWLETEAFCLKLSQVTGKKYRLPSEAEWEYACRAGTTMRYYFGNNRDQLGDYAWFDKNSRGRTHPVGEKKPNFWGLYDMHGHVWEWCEDTWHQNYRGAPDDGKPWIQEGKNFRVLRGGCWDNSSRGCRSSYRPWGDPVPWNRDFGFRVVCEF
ncbi:MAG: SUMF1/EgtB/PvdO family nonheme iron enzyme [Cyanobacteria bacterium RI_101]|nr:SUMF1/EgtB/PvdO family nonheme iron enzyme [Cyanobacteria bacterium RI_101]